MTSRSTLTRTALASLACLTLAAGCKKTDDSKANFTKAIDTWYEARPLCLWSDPIKFPVQVDSSDTSKTTDYDALLDQGLLTRTTAEKTKLIILSKQVTIYDLSDKGRSAWTADTQQPGYGNFCYGKPSVSTIDSYTPTTDQPGATTTVQYHYSVSGAPGWATAAETQNAYPQVRSDLAAPAPATATLTNTPNGWAVTTGPSRPHHKAPASADYGIVQ